MEPATKADLDVLRNELTEKIDSLRDELKEERDSLREELTEKMRGIETTLLKEFRKWAVPATTRMRVFEVSSQGLAERLTLVEERLDALETR